MRLIRYVTRPPLAQKRLTLLPNGNVKLELKRPFSDGTTDFVFEPLDFISKLAAIVVPPRTHRTRYHGAWARRAKLKKQVAPQCRAEEGCVHASKRERRRHYEWAKLMRRVFKVDVLTCPRCKSGAMQRIAWVMSRDAIVKILGSIGLPADSPQPAPSRVWRQESLGFGFA